ALGDLKQQELLSVQLKQARSSGAVNKTYQVSRGAGSARLDDLVARLLHPADRCQGAGRYHLRSAGEYLRSGVFECANYSRGGSKEATLKKRTSKTRACAHRFSCTCKMKFKLL
ncbi:hypothetical protein GBAR_LOCUS1747, partial [Geodia barretti]